MRIRIQTNLKLCGYLINKFRERAERVRPFKMSKWLLACIPALHPSSIQVLYTLGPCDSTSVRAGLRRVARLGATNSGAQLIEHRWRFLTARLRSILPCDESGLFDILMAASVFVHFRFTMWYFLHTLPDV